MRKTLIFYGVFFVWITPRLRYNEAVLFKFSNAVCESYNKSWYLINQCRLQAVNRNRNTFNFNGTILHPIYKIDLHGQLFKKANGYKPWLFNVSIDVCRFLNKPYNPIASILYKLFIDFSNFNHTCPYNGTQLIQGFYLRPEILKLPFPTGDYLLTLLWFFDKKPQVALKVYFAYTEDF